MNKTFSSILLIQPMISSLSIVISLFCVMVNAWFAGIGFIIFAYTQFLAMCSVGQSVQSNVNMLYNFKQNVRKLTLESRSFLHRIVGCSKFYLYRNGSCSPLTNNDFF